MNPAAPPAPTEQTDLDPGGSDNLFASLAPVVTLHDVELCKAGTWRAGTGLAPITETDLQSMVSAAQDPEIDRAPLVIGHVDPRFRHLADGEPALGWVIPRRVVDGTLIGDITDVPAKMAAILPRAYRRRSVELRFDVTTPAGHKHRTVLSALSALGVQRPAVKGLADVEARYSADPEPNVVDIEVGEQPATQADTPPAPLASSGDAATVPHDEPVERDQPGGLVAPQRFTDERLRQLLGLPADADVTRFQEAFTAPAPVEAKGEELPEEERKADDTNAPSPFPTPQNPQPTNPRTPTETPTARPEQRLPVAASEGTLPEGTVLLSDGQLAQLQADAQRGVEAAQHLDQQRRDQRIAVALSEGRLTPNEAATWRDALDRDESGTGALLDALTKGRVPLSPVGSAMALSDAGDTEARAAEDQAWDTWERQAFPELESVRPQTATH